MCEYGRETIESLGRRKRSVASNQTSESEDDMTLSQEILVLDFGDEKQSEFLRQETSSAEFGKGKPTSLISKYLFKNFFDLIYHNTSTKNLPQVLSQVITRIPNLPKNSFST